MSLVEEGFRYLASPERTDFRWIHPAEIEGYFSNWTDCTDMTDAQYDAFVSGKGDER